MQNLHIVWVPQENMVKINITDSKDSVIHAQLVLDMCNDVSKNCLFFLFVLEKKKKRSSTVSDASDVAQGARSFPSC